MLGEIRLCVLTVHSRQQATKAFCWEACFSCSLSNRGHRRDWFVDIPRLLVLRTQTNCMRRWGDAWANPRSNGPMFLFVEFKRMFFCKIVSLMLKIEDHWSMMLKECGYHSFFLSWTINQIFVCYKSRCWWSWFNSIPIRISWQKRTAILDGFQEDGESVEDALSLPSVEDVEVVGSWCISPL